MSHPPDQDEVLGGLNIRRVAQNAQRLYTVAGVAPDAPIGAPRNGTFFAPRNGGPAAGRPVPDRRVNDRVGVPTNAGWKRSALTAAGSAASPWDCGAGLSPVNSYPERHARQADHAGARA